MEEVGSHDSDGVGGPEFEAWVILFDVKHEGGAGPEVGGRHRSCDELGQAFGVLEDSQWFVTPPRRMDRR